MRYSFLLICSTFVGYGIAATGKVYNIIPKYVSWVEANIKCRSMNKTLAMPKSVSEIHTVVEEKNLSGPFWLGGYLDHGRWKWNKNVPYTREGCFVKEYYNHDEPTKWSCSYTCYGFNTGYIIYKEKLCICLKDFDQSQLPQKPRNKSCDDEGWGTVRRFYGGYWRLFNKVCFAVPIFYEMTRNSVLKCSLACGMSPFISLQNNSCTCLIDYYRPTRTVDDRHCGLMCSGNHEEKCGGAHPRTTSLYKKTSTQDVDAAMIPKDEYDNDGKHCLAINMKNGSSETVTRNCYDELQPLCHSDKEETTTVPSTTKPTTTTSSDTTTTVPPTTTTKPTTELTSEHVFPTYSETGDDKSHQTTDKGTSNSLHSDNGDEENAQTGMYVGVGVGIAVIAVIVIAVVIIWRRRMKAKKKKPVSLSMNEVNSEHFSRGRSQQNQSSDAVAVNNSYELDKPIASTYGAIHPVDKTSDDVYGKIWTTSENDNATRDEYSYATRDQLNDYDYAYVNHGKTDTTPKQSETPEYDKLGVIKKPNNSDSTGNTYSRARKDSEDYSTNGNKGPSNITGNEYSHIGTDEDMYELEKTSANKHISDDYSNA